MKAAERQPRRASARASRGRGRFDPAGAAIAGRGAHNRTTAIGSPAVVVADPRHATHKTRSLRRRENAPSAPSAPAPCVITTGRRSAVDVGTVVGGRNDGAVEVLTGSE
ncbi:MAG TPA: hypothetical protein VID68_12455 [Solirubrobacteraceae bacterium]|jgi:hypothetical protein